MNKKQSIISVILSVCIVLAIICLAFVLQSKHIMKQSFFNNHSIGQRKKNSSAKTPESSEPAPQVIEKTAEEKQAIVDADAARMDALGLDYIMIMPISHFRKLFKLIWMKWGLIMQISLSLIKIQRPMRSLR